MITKNDYKRRRLILDDYPQQTLVDIKMKKLQDQMRQAAREKAKEPGKIFGKCEGCEFMTVLVEETGLCGPCCFGEADTINGNW